MVKKAIKAFLEKKGYVVYKKDLVESIHKEKIDAENEVERLKSELAHAAQNGEDSLKELKTFERYIWNSAAGILPPDRTVEYPSCVWLEGGLAFYPRHISTCCFPHSGGGGAVKIADYTGQDLPIEQRLRDVIGWEIGDGTAQISKLVASREIFGREYLPY